jgi:hypothetical protein
MARQVTITLDDDVAKRLERDAARTGTTVNDVVNEAVRKLLPPVDSAATAPFVVRARNLGKPLIDLECTSRALELLDELERQ